MENKRNMRYLIMFVIFVIIVVSLYTQGRFAAITPYVVSFLKLFNL
jgi:t-SNARE complex subunit (syntaxin)